MLLQQRNAGTIRAVKGFILHFYWMREATCYRNCFLETERVERVRVLMWNDMSSAAERVSGVTCGVSGDLLEKEKSNWRVVRS